MPSELYHQGGMRIMTYSEGGDFLVTNIYLGRQISSSRMAGSPRHDNVECERPDADHKDMISFK